MLSNIGPLELLIVAALLVILVTPSVIAYRRKVERLWLVVLVNVIAGPTGLLWFVALYMATTMRTRPTDITLPAGSAAS
ncbi:immunity protein [Streptomyces sp. CBMAI 2042]|uniref:superinfection immunity protein n=1 Tax=Streptomyces sp. CBMAI 2042 TaxID=2305222 RepID=UPI000F1E59BD|nr:superinfection immunity protein [Streptomyces sp. CBMAI 2042]RLV64267.1 immunity protein [Streptomyces sp. CBMAI 2042]